jgi:conserved hypothetical protein
MTKYIATFHTHLAALMTSRALSSAGVRAQMAPVPRVLSSSCGTCVRYEADTPMLDAMDEDVERVYCIETDERYELILENE